MIVIDFMSFAWKIYFTIFRLFLSHGRVFRKWKWILFYVEKLAFTFLINSLIFNFLSFLIFFCQKKNFVAVISFLSFQEPPRGKPRILWMASEIFWEYQPEHVQNFREIFISNKKSDPNPHNSLLPYELRRSSTGEWMYVFRNYCYSLLLWTFPVGTWLTVGRQRWV